MTTLGRAPFLWKQLLAPGWEKAAPKKRLTTPGSEASSRAAPTLSSRPGAPFFSQPHIPRLLVASGVPGSRLPHSPNLRSWSLPLPLLESAVARFASHLTPGAVAVSQQQHHSEARQPRFSRHFPAPSASPHQSMPGLQARPINLLLETNPRGSCP